MGAGRFQPLYEDRDENFGNARDVRNIFEQAVARQANRVAALENPGREDLMALTEGDPGPCGPAGAGKGRAGGSPGRAGKSE